MTIRFYKIALALSLLGNVLFALGIWYYGTIEDTFGLVKMVVEMFN